VQLAISYYTAAGEDSALVKRFRPRIQEAVRAGWETIGIKVELGRLNGNDFFNVSPENEYSYAHFYRDVQMFSSGPSSPFPDPYFEDWYAGPENINVAQRANDWSGWNLQRYVNPEFDTMYEEARTTIDPERAVELFIAMNDLIVNDFVVVPLVARPQRILPSATRSRQRTLAPARGRVFSGTSPTGGRREAARRRDGPNRRADFQNFTGSERRQDHPSGVRRASSRAGGCRAGDPGRRQRIGEPRGGSHGNRQ
jgi:ABC-type transport system substrate-binding protein